MPIGFDHDLRDSFSVAVRHAGLEEIAHRVDEHQLRRPPAKRLSQLLWNKAKIKPLLVRMSLNPTKALGEGLRVAMLASGADFGAATDGVPGSVGPFDSGVQGHRLSAVPTAAQISYPAASLCGFAGCGSHKAQCKYGVNHTVGHVSVENIWRQQPVCEVVPQVHSSLVYVNHFQVSPQVLG